MKAFRRVVSLWAVVVAATACGGESNGSAGSATTERQPTTVVDVPTTTVAPVTAAPTTTVARGSTIARETALAVNRCFELWSDAQSLGSGAGFVYEADMEALTEACDAATAQVEVDQIGAVGAPVNELALVLATLNLVVSFAVLDFTMSGCEPSDGACLIDPADVETFLQLDEFAVGELPEAFRGYVGMFTPTVEDIEGLTVES
jgi:hypothetical protein